MPSADHRNAVPWSGMKRGYRYGSLARKWFFVLLGFGSASAVAKARACPNHSPRVVEQEGFYRVELGDVEVTALSDGTTPLYDAPCGAGFHGDVIAHEDRYGKKARHLQTEVINSASSYRAAIPPTKSWIHQSSAAHPLISIMERCGVI